MSGKVAVALAAWHPPGLAGAVLVAPSPPCPEPMTDDARASLRTSFDNQEGAAQTARAISVKDADGPTVFERIVAGHMHTDRPAWDAWLDTGSREDITAVAGQASVPVLIVAGADDAELGPEVQRCLTLLRLSSARMEVVPGARQLVRLDRPAAMAKLIEALPTMPS